MEKKEVSGAWYILPFFFGIIGGLIAWAITKKQDPKKAVSFLWVGGIIFVVSLLFVGVISHIVMLSLDDAKDHAENVNRSAVIGQIRSLAEISMALSENWDYEDFYKGEDEDLQNIIREYGVNDDFAANIDDSNSKRIIRVNIQQGDGPEFIYDSYCAQIKLTSGSYRCVDAGIAVKEISDETSSGPCFEGYDEETPLYTCP